MSQLSDDLKHHVNKSLDDLRSLRDEIRVRLHLASMEARTRWNEELEPRFQQVERQAREAGEKAGESVRKALQDVQQAYKDFRSSLNEKKEEKKA